MNASYCDRATSEPLQLFENVGFHVGPREAELFESLRLPDMPEGLDGTQVPNETFHGARQFILFRAERPKRVDLRKMPLP
jgi:hypothetical protein